MVPRRSARLNRASSSVATAAPQSERTMVRARSSGSSRVSRVTKTGKPGGQPRGKDLSLNSVPTAATQVPPPPSEAEGVITTGDASFLARPDMPDHQKPAESRSTSPPPPSVPLHHRHTNATLLTPRGSRISACQPCSPPPAGIVSAPGILEKQVTSSPTTAVPAPVTAAAPGMLLEQGVAHLLAKAPQLKPVIEQHPCRLFAPDSLAAAVDPFDSLVSGVLGQQVSGAAARSIRDRFVALFPVNEAVKGNHGSGSRLTRPFPTPEQVAVADLAVLRTAGLSQRKAEYITGLAAKFVSGELNARKLLEDSDEELMEQLLAVRGLGRWSVEMFACFALKRTDIFSTGDLGVQRGMAAFMGKDVEKLKAKGGKFKYMSEKEMLDIAAPFSPYRSLFMWYMWRIQNVDVSFL